MVLFGLDHQMLGVVLQFLFGFQVAAAPQPSAADILGSAIKATGEAGAAAYVVRRDYTDDSGGKHKGSTSIVLTKSPFQFRAEHQEEGQSLPENAVSDGKVTRSSSNGRTEERLTFGSSGRDAMIVTNDATFDVAATWHLLLDPDYLRKAVASGRLLFLWEDDVEDDPCNVIVYARDGWTDYLWISARTGLPRATQRLNLQHGRAILGPRYELTDIHLDPPIPPGSFDLRRALTSPPGPTGSKVNGDESARSAVAASVAPSDLIGRPLPALEVRDAQYKPLLLSDLKGKTTLVTFWAPWCAPCIEELATLRRVQSDFGGRIQVVAIAVQDRREKALEFIRAHPQYKFSFFTDPDMEDDTSRLASFFKISGIPVNVLSDEQGRIVGYWFGFDGEEDIRHRLANVASPAGR